MDGNVIWKIIGWQGGGAVCVCVCVYLLAYLDSSPLSMDCLSQMLKQFLHVSDCNMSLGLALFKNGL